MSSPALLVALPFPYIYIYIYIYIYPLDVALSFDVYLFATDVILNGVSSKMIWHMQGRKNIEK